MYRWIVLGVSLALMFASNGVFACATCMVGDPTISTMGTEKPFAGRMRLGADYIKRGETVGPPDRDLETEEERMTINFSYTLNEFWTFAASLPFVTKSVSRYDLTAETGSGVGDIDLAARWYIGKDDSFAVRYIWGMSFGLRAPTSKKEKSGGKAIDIDAQPGAGATIPSAGAWVGFFGHPWFYYLSGSVQHALTDGYQGYQAGDVLLVTGMVQYALIQSLALQLSLDSRFKRPDEYSGVKDIDSGGMLLMATPGLAWMAIEDVVLSMNYQIPLIENARGHQEEDPLLRIGAAYDF